MNSEQVMALSGRELDEQVAVEVMGWQRAPYMIHDTFLYCPPGRVHVSTVAPVPAFSTDISAAWSVMEKMMALGYEWDIRMENPHEPFYVVSFGIRGEATGRNAAECICRAALLAVAGRDER